MPDFPILNLLAVLLLLGGGIHLLVSRRWPGPGTTLADRVRLGRTELLYWSLFSAMMIYNLDGPAVAWPIPVAAMTMLVVLMLLIRRKLNRVARGNNLPAPLLRHF